MTAIKLRSYQREAIDAVFAAWAEGVRRPAIVLPTGAGKTVVFSALVKRWRELNDDHAPQDRASRVMVLAHRDELVDQAIAKLRAVMPGVNVGKIKAEDNDLSADVVVCSVQTLASQHRRDRVVIQQRISGKIGLIITDECHHAAAPSYKKIYAAFPDALQLGVTATMARGDGVGLGSVWEDVVYSKSILWMISKNYLTDVRTVQVDLKELDMSSVKTTFASASKPGDWQAGSLGEALMEAEADQAIARAYREHAGDRQGVVFTPTVETARAACKALDGAGVPSGFISGETSREERHVLYQDYRSGSLQVLVNCMVLTEGFDMPQVSAIVIGRPTRNAALYTQMVGRGLRPFPGKNDCLVLDLVGASANRLRTLIDLAPGEVEEIREGETLAEAVMREAEEGDRRIPAGSIAFELRAREVNSFGASGAAWVRTPGGVMFIGCGKSRVFLWPVKGQSGLRNVCVQTDGRAWQVTEHTGLDISAAMAWGEAVAEDYADFSTSKSARWRQGAPSDAQLAKASRYGIDAGRMSRGQLSHAIDMAVAAQIFDPYVTRVDSLSQ